MSQSIDSRVENHVADLRALINGRRAHPVDFAVASTSGTSVFSPTRHRTRSRSPRRSRSRSPARSYRNPSRSRSRSPRYSRTEPERRREHFVSGESWSRHPSPPRSSPPREVETQRADHVVAADDTNSREKASFIPHDLSREIIKWGCVSINPDESKAIRETFKLNFEKSSTSFSPPSVDGWMARKIKEAGKNTSKAVEVTEKSWLTTQYKVFDIASPLIYLLDELENGPPMPRNQIVAMIRASLMQWGRAFSHISDRRRANLLSSVVPGASHLLEDPKSFSWKERRSELFGQRFFNAMVESRKQDETLAALQPAKKHSYSTRNRDNGGGGQSKSQSFRGAGARGARGSHRGGYVLVETSPTSYTPHFFSPPSSLVGGRLRFFRAAWAGITKDPWILNGVEEGFLLEFETVPIFPDVPGRIGMSAEMESVCDREVDDLLAKGAVREIVDGSPGYVSSFFCVPKKGRDLYRPIVNLKGLNYFLSYEHFKMEGLVTVRGLLRKNDWMVKVDLKDAYLTVPIHPSHHKFLRFLWRDRIFEFNCLTFGLASAPRWFTKIVKVAVAQLRERGLRMVVYLDDILLINESREGVLADLSFLLTTFESLGFIINWRKSDIVPSRAMEYLGVLWNTELLTCALPGEKVDSIGSSCLNILSLDRVRLSALASVLGSFVWAVAAVPFAQAHCRSLQSQFIKESRRVDGDLTSFCRLTVESRRELLWWSGELALVNGRRFAQQEPDLIIFSDASLTGWGASCNGVPARGPWTTSDKYRHINELELWAAFFAVKSFAPHSKRISIRIFIDNTTAVSYINKCGGTRSRSLSRVAEEISFWCESRGISLEAFFIPGRLNTAADAESRAKGDSSDWRLCADVFNEIARLWPVDIDLFASAWSSQLPEFCSWRPQPGAYAVNAFSINWAEFNGYAFPPFSLILTCLNKIRRELADVVLVAPVWPSQPWYPLLLEMVTDIPRILNSVEDLLVSSLGARHPLLRQGVVLAAWRLSGNPCLSRAFRGQLSTSSWPEFDQLRRLHTSPHGTLGCVGTCDGVRIPCLAI